jgi:hypothetical protein
MSFFDLVVGKPLAISEERAGHIGPIAGIPVFGLDALSSAAYGPEAALTLLIPLGLLVKATYRETIANTWVRPPQELIDLLERWLINISG